MNPTALKAAAKVGFPRDKIIGVWWAGSEEDVIPAGDAAKGYIDGRVQRVRDRTSRWCRRSRRSSTAQGKGNLEDQSRIGSVYHMRGIVHGIITVEAIRNAQEKFGKGKVMTGEQVRWGLENLDLSEARLKQLGAAGLMPPLKMSCADHEGSGLGEVPAVGRPALEGRQRLDHARQGDAAADDRGIGRQVREGEEHHAARLLEGSRGLTRAVS